MSVFDDKIAAANSQLSGRVLNLFEEMNAFAAANNVVWREINPGDEWEHNVVDNRINFLINADRTIYSVVTDANMPETW